MIKPYFDGISQKGLPVKQFADNWAYHYVTCKCFADKARFLALLSTLSLNHGGFIRQQNYYANQED